MSSNTNKRLHAERLYTEDGWTKKDIASTVGVSENTVGNWAKKYEWDYKRDIVTSSPHKVKQLLYKELNRVLDGEEPRVNADSISKFIKALESVDKRVNAQTSITVMKLFTDFATTQDLEPDVLLKMIDLAKGFIKNQIDNEQ